LAGSHASRDREPGQAGNRAAISVFPAVPWINPATFSKVFKMAYTVLARKYRSQTFDDIIGQEPIAQTLKNAIKTDRVAHAYLFTGTRGVGKTTTARVLAKALNCLSFDAPTVEPCGKCDSCIAVNTGDDIDVIEIDGASNNGVEEVRRLRENAVYRPARARYKIYVIDEVHMLSNSAFNALLKILEEPPSHVKFIFATTEPNKVPATVQSRCQRFDFRNISPRLIAEQLGKILKQEGVKYEKDLILPLAKMANGSMRDGLSLLDRLISTGEEPLTPELLERFLGCPNSEKIYELTRRIGDSDAAGVLTTTEELVNSGFGEVQVVDALASYMRDLMVVKAAGTESETLALTEEQKQQASELAEQFDIAGLVYNITALEKLRWTLKNSDTPRALLDALMLRLALSEHFLNVDELLEKQRGVGTADIKKNEVAVRNRTSFSRAAPSAAPTEGRAPAPVWGDINSIKENWRSILNAVGAELGNGTTSLLSSAEPTGFEDGVLTVTFAASNRAAKQICASQPRRGRIEAVLGKHCKGLKRIELVAAADKHPEAFAQTDHTQTNGRKGTEILSDPAVKTVLIGLDAKITGIEQNR